MNLDYLSIILRGWGGGGGYMEGKKYMWRKTCFGKNDLSAVLKFINFAS